MRRIAAVAVGVLLVLVLGAGSALAAGGRNSVDTSPVSFTLSSATCSNLPEGTTITGTGTEKSVTTITDLSGVTKVMNSTHAYGTATDQDHNVYVFGYSNAFRVSNTVADPDVLSGLMSDHFSLSGNGPATLSNGFVATITASADFSSFSAEPISSHGDPISFPDGRAHCDPL
jgi:hypothetical protein